MDLNNIYELMNKFSRSGLAKLELREADTVIKMEMPKKTEVVQSAAAPAPAAAVQTQSPAPAPQPAEDGSFIKSPIVGTFYAAPEEGGTPFVEEGDRVAKGATVCIVEAMKMMNEINAPCDCIIEEVCAVNASPVGYDDPLFRIREL